MFIAEKSSLADSLDKRKQSGKSVSSYSYNQPWISTGTCLSSAKLAIILVCTSIVVWQAKECLWRYALREHKAIMRVMKTGHASFLAFTVCPAFFSAYKNEMFEHFGTTKGNYIWGGDYTTNSSENPKEVYNVLTHSLTEIIHEVAIGTADEKKDWIVLDFWNEKDALFVPKYDDKLGRCFSMELNETVTQLGVSQVIMKANMDIYIYLHHPGQYMDVDSMSKVFANLGEKVFLDLVYEISDNTLEKQDPDLPCSSALDKTYDDCVYHGIANDLEMKFGCVVPFLPEEAMKNKQICQSKNETFNRELLKRYDFLSANGQRTVCDMPCATMDVFMGLPFPGTDDKAYIKMYVKSTVKTKKTVYDYTFLSLFAEIGGYTGLLLGVSFVNLTILIDRFGYRMIK